MEAWVEVVIEITKSAKPPFAYENFLSAEELVISRLPLSPNRANTVRIFDGDPMNSGLFLRIYPPGDSFPTTPYSHPAAFPLFGLKSDVG